MPRKLNIQNTLESGVTIPDGYAIAEKREEERQVPGLPPYEQMKRVLHVTTYRLERGGEAVVCEVTYDSQRDTISTACQ